MNWENVLKEIMAFSAGASIFVSALFILAKYLFEHSLAKDLDKFKADISLEIEKYKSQLEKENIKHTIQYSKLHTDRAEIIKELYFKICDVESSMSRFDATINDNNEFNEKGRIMIKAYVEYVDYYKKNKIFFKSEYCSLMKEVEDTFKEYLPIDLLQKKTLDERKEFWKKEKAKILKQIRFLKEKLEDDFRSMLGVELNI